MTKIYVVCCKAKGRFEEPIRAFHEKKAATDYLNQLKGNANLGDLVFGEGAKYYITTVNLYENVKTKGICNEQFDY